MRTPSLFLVLSLSVLAAACHRGPADPLAALRDDPGPTPEEARAVLEAIKTETDEKAYGAMMITLGASGLPEAEPVICGKMYAPDARNRAWANKALKLYLQRNRAAKGCPPPGEAPAAAAPAPAAGAPAAAPASGNGVTIGPK